MFETLPHSNGMSLAPAAVCAVFLRSSPVENRMVDSGPIRHPIITNLLFSGLGKQPLLRKPE
jgi:hypothetical protein